MVNALAGWLRKISRRYVTYITVTPLLVTVAIVAASVVVAGLIQRNVETLKLQSIDKQLKENQLLVQNRFNLYAQVVWSGAGLLNSAPVDRQSWQQFVSTLQLPKRFPAVTAMAVTRIVKPGEEDAFLQGLSQEYGQPMQFANVTPGADMDVYMYTQPERPTSAGNMGFNLNSDPTRRQALQQATDTNDIAMTGRLQLLDNVRAGTRSNDPAFLLYAPYYHSGLPLDTVEDRRAAIWGHVSASFRTQEVFERAFESVDQSHVAIKVYMGDGTNKDQLAYSGQPLKAKGEVIERTQTVGVFGQRFTIHYDFDGTYQVTAAQLRSPLYMIILGGIIGALIGTITFFFLRGRHHQLLLDKERDIARAKDELLSLASHQLRTPATGVKQYLGMVLQGFAGEFKPDQEKLLEKAYRSNERQLHTINDILHLAKLDLGRIVLAKTSFELGDLINDVIDEQEQDFQTAQLTITKRIIKKAPVYADQHMLRMVIENLISNAIKYTNPGGRIWVRLQAIDGGYKISVKDTGVGIAQTDLHRLFQQFSRITNPRSHLVTGTGVGLYLSKHLMFLHGGEIEVKSTPGKGSSFVIYIPKTDEKL